MIGVGNMIANLPLLFANANPTALSKISVGELEKFITFMVTCSWGHDTAREIRQPPWWPADVHFSHPFKRPRDVPKDWEKRLKHLVRKCYDYHKSAFLLVFSAQLARYPRKRLRYVDNHDHTTSLYFIPTGRLLVTFRNENKFYDQLKVPKSNQSMVVEAQMKSTDIYLCDNCDSHFDNLNVLRSHERLCNNEEVPSSTCSGGLHEFLSALKLQPKSESNENNSGNSIEVRSRHIRSAANVDRGPPYPFSSLAYMKNVKSSVQRDTTHSRERIERYCTNTSFGKNNGILNKGKTNQFPVRYRRPIDSWYRKQVFPNQRNKIILDLNSQLLLLRCRPAKVNIKRMSLESMQNYIDNLREEAKIRNAQIPEKDIEFVGGFVSDSAIEEDALKVVDPLTRVVENNNDEIIDLCSDDESYTTNENCDPRAGVTCVMRGGAVLRRTATTPSSLPDEPCGARHRHVPSAVLQPHPVILFTQSLGNFQTISID